MDREKIIEEIENILFEYDAHEESAPWVHIKYAHKIIDAIIPEGSVVLTREEYAKFKKNVRENEFYALYNEIDQAHKEIKDAVNERTIAIIKDLIGHRFAYYMKDKTNGTVVCCADYVVDEDDVKFLEEKYKVEAKE